MRDTERSSPGDAALDVFDLPVSALWLLAIGTNATSKQRRRALPLIDVSIDKCNVFTSINSKVKCVYGDHRPSCKSFQPFLSSKIEFQIYKMNDIQLGRRKDIVRAA
jgi:hypothetical protein